MDNSNKKNHTPKNVHRKDLHLFCFVLFGGGRFCKFIELFFFLYNACMNAKILVMTKGSEFF